MTTILILESNSPDMLRNGKSGAVPFVQTLWALDPELVLRVVNPYARAVEDADLDGVDGMVFTGSGVDWSTDAPQAAPLRAAMARGLATGRPVWGSCNGMQLAATVLGGDGGASPKGTEWGMARDVALTEVGAVHPMMAGKAPVFSSPCVHRDEVQVLPEGAVVIAGNAHSPVQAMVYERDGVDFWGVQYHPECSAPVMAGWLRGRDASLAGIVADLEVAEQDAAAAARQGTSMAELGVAERARELGNWIAKVGARA